MKKNTSQACLEEIKKYSWLGLPELGEDEVALLIKEYIDTHKWLINETIPFEITFEQAAFSWYENVYQPIIRALQSTGLRMVMESKHYSKLVQFRSVSDTHFYRNGDKKVSYVSYEDTCRGLLKSIRGSWFIKLVASLKPQG